MYIKPIDYVNLISKTQEVAKIKQSEMDKAVLHFDNRIIQQDKQVKENMQKVTTPPRSENIIINKNNEEKNNNQYFQHSNRNKKSKEKEEKVSIEPEKSKWMYYRYKGLDEVIKINTILNAIGIILIILSIIIIIRNSRKEQRIYEEISEMYDDVKYYYNSLGKAMISFDDLIEKSIDKIEKKAGSN